jgi:hypothetical protein
MTCFVMPPKKAWYLVPSSLPWILTQIEFSWEKHEAKKREVVSPTPQGDELDHEINKHEAIHQQVEKKKEKMLRLSELQKKIDEATEEMQNIS